MSVVFFVLFLAISGILLNHSIDLGLDRRYVSWQWLLDGYGIEVPEPSASFAGDDKRVTLMGERLFFNGKEIEATVSSLAGLGEVDGLVVVAGGKQALVLTSGGDLVESMDLSVFLRDPIDRIGTSRGGIVLMSRTTLFRSDTEVTRFERWDATPDDVAWSSASNPGVDELAEIQAAYRGRGLSVERVILDLHSGRVFSLTGRLLLDLVAILMVVLSLTGIFLSRARNRRQNGNRSQVTRPPVT